MGRRSSRSCAATRRRSSDEASAPSSSRLARPSGTCPCLAAPSATVPGQKIRQDGNIFFWFLEEGRVRAVGEDLDLGIRENAQHLRRDRRRYLVVERGQQENGLGNALKLLDEIGFRQRTDAGEFVRSPHRV